MHTPEHVVCNIIAMSGQQLKVSIIINALHALLVSRPPVFIIQYYGILKVWFPGTAQIISKKEVWLVFQGNNEGRCGR